MWLQSFLYEIRKNELNMADDKRTPNTCTKFKQTVALNRTIADSLN
jgi:hypothetical protein